MDDGVAGANGGWMKRFERIVCAIDFSDGSRSALAMAVTLARWYGACLTVLHVHANWPLADMLPSVRPLEARPTPLPDNAREAMLDAVQRFVASVGVPSGLDVRVELADSLDVTAEILSHAEGADAVVIGTHGRSGFERLMLGSVAERVLRKATCPVLVVPPHAKTATGAAARGLRIVCPIDFSEASLAALGYATSLATEANGALTLLHVIEVPPELRESPVHDQVDVDRIRAAAEAECLQRLRALIPEAVRHACTVHTSVEEGRAAREIVRAAAGEGDDLIVMGVRGRNAVDLMVFGSNTQYVVRAASCPVLVVHGAAHQTTAKRAPQAV
jgi:nucleotide-binding universal stress UspA family protein